MILRLGSICFWQCCRCCSIREYLREPSHIQRAALQAALEREGGHHLIVVRYLSPKGRSHEEWVWNAVDIDASPVVWASEMNQ